MGSGLQEEESYLGREISTFSENFWAKKSSETF
jgi:hypothetical protein